MSVGLIPVSDRSQWNHCLQQCGNFDCYHTASYHFVAKQQGEGDPYLFFFRQGDDCTAIPFLLRPQSEIEGIDPLGEHCDATSVYGYPGVVANIEKTSERAEEFRIKFQKAFIGCLKELKVTSFFSRTNPMFDNAWLLDGAAEVLNLSSTIAIDLKKNCNEQLAEMSKGHRHDIRKAYREGVKAEEDFSFNHLDDFVEAYNETMCRVGAHDYYFFPKEYYINLKEELGGSLKLYVARFAGRIISASLFLVTEKIIQYHLSGTFYDCLPFQGAKIILDTVRTWGSDCKFSWLHLGGGVGSAEDGLFQFKAGFSRTRLPFRVVRLIVDHCAYERACRQRDAWLKYHGQTAAVENFFPKYRSPVLSTSSAGFLPSQ